MSAQESTCLCLQSARASNRHVPDFETVIEDTDGVTCSMNLVHHMTACSAVLGSNSRLRWAVDLGYELKVDCCLFQRIAGNGADIETLMELNELHGMPYTKDTSRGAAASGFVSKLRWLLDQQHCPQAANICKYALYYTHTHAGTGHAEVAQAERVHVYCRVVRCCSPLQTCGQHTVVSTR
jgi:hypothetical protein